LEELRRRKEKVQARAKELEEQGLSQKVLTEPEARLMRTARHGYQVAYNAQTAVDAEHKLVAAFDLVNEGNDQRQLHPMAQQCKEALGAEQLTVVGDTGYSNGEHGQRCADDGITAVVPRAETINKEGKEYFTRDRFSYDAASDTWTCPAGQTLSCRKVSQTEQNKTYWGTACADCPLKPQCTRAPKRMIVRHFYEDAREEMHRRAMNDRKWMVLRRSVVEHPFGTMKWLMGYPRFLVRGLRKAKAELDLIVMGYNFKRAIAILGTKALLQALQPQPAGQT
jgi:Transposase DDE domain